MSPTTGRRPFGGGVRSLAGLAYISSLVLAVIVILALGDLPTLLTRDTVPLVVLTAMAAAGSLRRVFRSLEHSLSIVSIVLVAAMPLLGPAGAALVGVLASVVPTSGLSLRWRMRAFNTSMAGLLGGVAGHVYVLFGGVFPAPQALSLTGAMVTLALPLMAANAAMIVLNAALISVMVWIEEGTRPSGAAWGMIKDGGVAYLAQGVIGFMLAVLWAPVGLGIGALVLVIGPILVAQWAAQQVADEAEANERTISALVAAGEAESIYSRGHSQRVAELSGLLARAAGRSAEDRRVLRMASLLHDIGTTAIPAQAWRGDPPYAEDQLDAYLRHPGQGVAMLTEIDFLEPALPGIESHHERWDGRGYPRGLVGADIPWHGRAIALADAYDSLTSARSYRAALTRDEALERLGELSGSLFDPDLVELLAGALRGYEDEVGPLPEDEVAAFGPAKDHDDPELSPAFARRRWRSG